MGAGEYVRLSVGAGEYVRLSVGAGEYVRLSVGAGEYVRLSVGLVSMSLVFNIWWGLVTTVPVLSLGCLPCPALGFPNPPGGVAFLKAGS